jgi:hypothetical protein
VASYQLTLKDRTTEVIDGVDAYQQEGQMTTFFRTGSGRSVVDTWSTRVASFRTSELVAIRRIEVGLESGRTDGTPAPARYPVPV